MRRAQKFRRRLISQMRFRNFIPGHENHVALNLVKLLAEDPLSHPMTIITGPSGCGKTHLANALALRLQKRSKLSSGFTNGHFFTQCVTRAYQHQQMDRIADELSALAILVFDNIELLSTMHRSQQELFSFIRDTERENKSLVLAISESALAGMQETDGPVMARLAEATVISVCPPSSATLGAYLQRKVDEQGVPLENIDISVLIDMFGIVSARGVSGLLAIMNAYSKWQGEPIDSDFIENLALARSNNKNPIAGNSDFN